MDTAILGSFGLIVIIFLIVLAILWFLLPFAVFGIKTRIDESNQLSKEILIELKYLNAESQDKQPLP